MNRRSVVSALLALGLAPRASYAQQAARVWRIGYLSSESADANPIRLKALRDSLRELGYVEGRNLTIERRHADGKYARLPGLAQELVKLKVDAIVPEGDKASVAAAGATATLPVVVGLCSDLVGLGLADSLARPGRNVTGWSGMGAEMQVKRLELLKETAPHIARVAVLTNPENSIAAALLRTTRAAAAALQLEILPVEAQNSGAVETALAAIVRQRAEALVVQTDTLFHANEGKITEFAIQRRLPAAGALGLSIPQPILLRADRVIG